MRITRVEMVINYKRSMHFDITRFRCHLASKRRYASPKNSILQNINAIFIFLSSMARAIAFSSVQYVLLWYKQKLNHNFIFELFSMRNILWRISQKKKQQQQQKTVGKRVKMG